MATPGEVLDFWLRELTPDDWYRGGEALDATCRARFAAACADARDGEYGDWLTGPDGALAYLILTDQLPRNIWRGDALSFASDKLARAAADYAIAMGWDLQTPLPQRQFFYLPLEHHEDLASQDRCVQLMDERLPGEDGNPLHARVHRAIIARFGRFPSRNAALGRTTTAAEAAWLEAGGYGAEVKAMREAQGGAAPG